MYQSGWLQKTAIHTLRHRMDGGVFINGPCTYCGLDTIDFCGECGIFVCRRCDTRAHWPAVGIVPEFGFVPPLLGLRTFRRR
jgi:hypothetical protein